MIASLPMYDTPATAAANDRFWQAIRRAYGRGPEGLDRAEDPHATWLRDDLVFSQTCGLPYRAGLHEKTSLIGTPDYGVEGCPPGYYTSLIVVRQNDPRMNLQDFDGAVLARNDIRSQSGWAAMVQHLDVQNADLSLSDRALDTGSHVASMRSVAAGKADLAAIDAITWAFSGRDTKITEGLRILDRTAPTPGLPFITGPYEDPNRLFDAVQDAIATLSLEDRHCLGLNGLVRIPASEYLAIPIP